MKIKWGLKIFNLTECDTSEKLDAMFLTTEPVYFRTVKDCFDYLGFKIPRCGHGYVGTKYIPGPAIHVEYLLTKYRA